MGTGEALCTIGGTIKGCNRCRWFLKKTVTIRSNNSASGSTHKIIESRVPVFTGELFTIAERWKPPACPPVEERIHKAWCIHAVK